MSKQPHKHHEGPITVEVCEGLIRDLRQMEDEIPVDCPVPGHEEGWLRVSQNWLGQLEYAQHRLQEVIDTITLELPLTQDYHGKIIDICLSVKDDFAFGKANNFVDPSKE